MPSRWCSCLLLKFVCLARWCTQSANSLKKNKNRVVDKKNEEKIDESVSTTRVPAALHVPGIAEKQGRPELLEHTCARARCVVGRRVRSRGQKEQEEDEE
eukprot:TRINITY_DN40993_c0_g1_i1.p2 TRINITY_DN40993_c0_g1~~TRINITY_DN40993_c0_g1_i1.p2  ORF type:complete len:111 (+),score=13.67 TRINITY_DN40993_c0_g1_i1:34-333(+)